MKVSIIVPVYNKEKELRQCLDSLAHQSLSDIEIIVIDDCSSDKSKDIIEEYAKNFSSLFKVIYNPQNLGIGASRNKGIAIARGEFLGFVDADDYVGLEMYHEYYDFAKKNRLDMVTGYYTKFGDCNELFFNEFFPISDVLTNPALLLQLDYGPCNKILKRSIVQKYQILFEEKLKYEDMPFIAKTLRHCKRVGHIGKSYYYYRIHSQSETTIIDQKVFDMFQIMDIVNNYYQDFSDQDVLDALNILQITRYMVQQKYQEDHRVRDDFIEKGYDYLKKRNPKWRENSWYRKENWRKRLVKNHPFILKFYCKLYRVFL